MTSRLVAFALAGGGRENVHVHVEERDALGHFRHSVTHLMGGPDSGHPQVVEIVMHDNLQLVIHEAPGDQEPPAYGDIGHHRRRPSEMDEGGPRTGAAQSGDGGAAETLRNQAGKVVGGADEVPAAAPVMQASDLA